MDNEKKQFLREKYQNNDPEYVKWGQDKSGYPVKWVRTSLDGNWIIYNEDDYLPVTERISNAFWGFIGIIFIAIFIYAIAKGDLTFP